MRAGIDPETRRELRQARGHCPGHSDDYAGSIGDRQTALCHLSR